MTPSKQKMIYDPIKTPNDLIIQSRAPFGKKTLNLTAFPGFETTPRICYRSRRNASLSLHRGYFSPDLPQKVRAFPAFSDNGSAYVVLVLSESNTPPKDGIVPTISSNGHTLHIFPDKFTITLENVEIASFPINANDVSKFLSGSME